MQKTDWFHGALHLALALAAIPVALDPISVGLGSAAVIEGDHKVKGQSWGRTFRDFAIRSVGAFIGIAIAALTGSLPVF